MSDNMKPKGGMGAVGKCVASLTSIAFVCTVLLLLCDTFLPKKPFVLDVAALTGDAEAKFAKVDDMERLGLPDAFKKVVSDVYYNTGEEHPATFIVRAKGTAESYGSFSLYIGVRAKSASEAEILGVMLDDKSIKSNGLFVHLLGKDNLQKFVGKTTHNEIITADVITDATKISNAKSDAVWLAHQTATHLWGQADKVKNKDGGQANE